MPKKKTEEKKTLSTEINGTVHYVQWEEPKNTFWVRRIPKLAEWFPWHFRLFILREEESQAAKIPKRKILDDRKAGSGSPGALAHLRRSLYFLDPVAPGPPDHP